MKKPRNRKKQILNYLGKVTLAFITTSLMISPSLAVDPAQATDQVISVLKVVQKQPRKLSIAH